MSVRCAPMSVVISIDNRVVYVYQIVRETGCGCSMRMISDKTTDGVIWWCPRKACCKKLSIHHHGSSFFAGSHLSLRQIVLMIYYWARNTKLSEPAHEVEVSEHTLMDWFNFIREVSVPCLL